MEIGGHTLEYPLNPSHTDEYTNVYAIIHQRSTHPDETLHSAQSQKWAYTQTLVNASQKVIQSPDTSSEEVTLKCKIVDHWAETFL